MLPTQNGAMRLFRVGGITVFLHYSWFIVAVIEVQIRSKTYGSLAWNVAEYLALFAIVLLHEFGHSLACRQTGGQADQIVLWPLGGVAYVNPPQRPGAVLWSIAAGPLVNVVLFVVFKMLGVVMLANGWNTSMPDAYHWFVTIARINLGLLIFNLLPVYPLDGGQILRALLWFFIGRAWSLMVSSVIGVLGALAIFALAFHFQSFWIGLVGFFMISRSVSAFKMARGLIALEKAPRHEDFACPACGDPPVRGAFWNCPSCATAFDTFDNHAACPKCGMQFDSTRCPSCAEASPLGAWKAAADRV